MCHRQVDVTRLSLDQQWMPMAGAEPKPYECFYVGVQASHQGQAQCPDDQSVQQDNVSPKLAVWARGVSC